MTTKAITANNNLNEKLRPYMRYLFGITYLCYLSGMVLIFGSVTKPTEDRSTVIAVGVIFLVFAGVLMSLIFVINHIVKAIDPPEGPDR
ncbi:MAG: hypothetical protein WAQ57_02450 [Candidatus Saccharimonadales bacterium]